ncbi:GA-like domain-containing protein, partial [Streptococcus equi]|uniref:GA-like domain-containing protein n=1 Tax=Streptococcus equi TaxID=1336 RepID=UPI000A55183D
NDDLVKARADVEAAKQAAQAAAAKKEEVERDGLVTPADKEAVDALIQAANEKVQTAKDSVNNLPTSEEKTQLTQDVNDISVVDSPVVTDANNNGTPDTDDVAA